MESSSHQRHRGKIIFDWIMKSSNSFPLSPWKLFNDDTKILVCFAALLLLSSISFLSLDLRIGKFLFLSAFTQAGKVGSFFLSRRIRRYRTVWWCRFLHEICFFWRSSPRIHQRTSGENLWWDWSEWREPDGWREILDLLWRE